MYGCAASLVSNAFLRIVQFKNECCMVSSGLSWMDFGVGDGCLFCTRQAIFWACFMCPLYHSFGTYDSDSNAIQLLRVHTTSIY